jgi:hypothetical protein
MMLEPETLAALRLRVEPQSLAENEQRSRILHQLCARLEKTEVGFAPISNYNNSSML